jgi:hypothetical protein
MTIMDTAFALSTAIGSLGVTGQLIASRHPVAGWSISIAAQPLWYAFYISVGGWGLIPLSTCYFAAAIVNLRAALHRRHTARTTIVIPDEMTAITDLLIAGDLEEARLRAFHLRQQPASA